MNDFPQPSRSTGDSNSLMSFHFQKRYNILYFYSILTTYTNFETLWELRNASKTMGDFRGVSRRRQRTNAAVV